MFLKIYFFNFFFFTRQTRSVAHDRPGQLRTTEVINNQITNLILNMVTSMENCNAPKFEGPLIIHHHGIPMNIV